MRRSRGTAMCVDTDLWEAASLWYSSRPSRRCALCIVFLREFGHTAVGINQSKRLGKPFAVAQGRHAAFVRFFEVIDLLAGLPAGHMPQGSLSEDAVQQSRTAENAGMSLMQRRERTPNDLNRRSKHAARRFPV